VTERYDGETLERVLLHASWPMVTVDTDKWSGYNGQPVGAARIRRHPTPTTSRRGTMMATASAEWFEALWTAIRNLLRLFRRVSKKHLYQYVALFE
jgi:hypothetical protein